VTREFFRVGHDGGDVSSHDAGDGDAEDRQERAGDEERDAGEAFVEPPIEPGRPKAENVAFVVLGALGALYVVARVAGLV